MVDDYLQKKINKLIKLGKSQKCVTYEDILSVFSESEVSSINIDELLLKLKENNINVDEIENEDFDSLDNLDSESESGSFHGTADLVKIFVFKGHPVEISLDESDLTPFDMRPVPSLGD